MDLATGKIVLMGSGELTATMVEVHKELLRALGEPRTAVFIDTPAGFQLNVDQLSQRAREYFASRVQHSMSVVSFKSHDTTTPFAAEKAFHALRKADFMLIGPGSPTYAVRQWKQTPIPDIMAARVSDGACLVAASAAALTVGRFTLPVYEIYKVGDQLHWIEGIDILGQFGMDCVVIPHWNNAEGGNHDTRFCYMGEPRFKQLVAMLPGDVSILGLDEHTACIIDLAREIFTIRGIGHVVLKRGADQLTFSKGKSYPLGILRGENTINEARLVAPAPPFQSSPKAYGDDNSFWHTIHFIQSTFQQSLEANDFENATNALLELDGAIWKGQQELETPEFISQSREILRDLMVLFGTWLSDTSRSKSDNLKPVVEELIQIRDQFRQARKWEEADSIRNCLMKANILIEDTDNGSRWHFNK